MSERDTRQLRQARHSAAFWDGVEREIEALDCADFALFMGADALAIEPRPAFERALSTRLQSVLRARWSN